MYRHLTAYQEGCDGILIPYHDRTNKIDVSNRLGETGRDEDQLEAGRTWGSSLEPAAVGSRPSSPYTTTPSPASAASTPTCPHGARPTGYPGAPASRTSLDDLQIAELPSTLGIHNGAFPR